MKKTYQKICAVLSDKMQIIARFFKKQSEDNIRYSHEINKYIDRSLQIQELLNNDTLELNVYAEKIAQKITQLDCEKGGIITAVYGEWGTGKTTIKDAIKNELGKASKLKKEKIVIFEFDPWKIPSNEDIAKSFLEELFNKIDTRMWITKKVSYILPMFQKVYSNSVTKIITNIIYAIITIFLWQFLLHNFVTIDETKTSIPQLSTNLSSLFVLFTVIMVIPIVFFLIENVFTKRQWSGIREAKTWISRNLPNKKVVVLIDDIDRLPKREIQDLVRLIKSVADFKNLIYVLFCQQNIVEDALKENIVDGADYLKKIVQLSYQMPKLPWNKIKAILFEKVFSVEIFGSLTITAAMKERFGKFSSTFLFKHIKTMRDIKKYMSGIIMSVDSFKKLDGILTVDLEDIIYLEGLKQFAVGAYNKLYQDKDKFLEINSQTGHNHNSKMQEYITVHCKNEVDLVNFLIGYNNMTNLPAPGQMRLIYQPTENNNRLFSISSFDKYFSCHY